MMGRAFITTVVTILAAAGVFINYELTQKHVAPAEAPAWFDAVCNPQDSAVFSCDEALKSRWAYFSLSDLSFKVPTEKTTHERIVPVSLLGMFYFSALFIWFFGVGRCSGDRRIWHLLPTLAVLGGVSVSAYFVYVMFTQFESKCPWCLAAHGINGLLFVGMLLLWPRRGRVTVSATVTPDAVAGDVQSANLIVGVGPTEGSAVGAGGVADLPATGVQPANPPSPDPRSNPSGRVVLVTAMCIAATLYAETLLYAHHQDLQLRKAFQDEMKRMEGDTESQLAQHFGHPVRKIKVRPDDPVRGGGAGMTLVMFSDFQCPACRRAAARLEKTILPQFDNRLRVVWKHYPLSKDCNPNLNRKMHPQACVAAYAAEAARLQGGNAKFWKMHDFLFANQAQLARLDWRAVAERLDLDVDRFLADMKSDTVRRRVREDVRLGSSLDIKSTPAMFLGGRPLPSYMLQPGVYDQRQACPGQLDRPP